jgi:hypothetical protein
MPQSGNLLHFEDEKDYQAIKELFASNKRMTQDFLSVCKSVCPSLSGHEFTHYMMLCGTYDKSALARLFSALRQTLFARKDYGPSGLHLNNIHHMASVFYDDDKNEWILVCGENCESVSQENIADKIIQLFAQGGNFVVLGINVFGLSSRLEMLHDYLRKLHDWDNGYLEAYSTRCLSESDHGGMKLIHLAAHFGRQDVVSFLFEAGASINEVIGENNAVLTLAIQAGNGKFVDFLLHHDADVNAQASRKLFTPLMMAVWVHDADIVERLLTESDIDVTKTIEISELVFARLATEENYSKEDVQAFIEKRAASGKLKLTAMDLAMFVNNAAVTQLLHDFRQKQL